MSLYSTSRGLLYTPPPADEEHEDDPVEADPSAAVPADD